MGEAVDIIESALAQASLSLELEEVNAELSSMPIASSSPLIAGDDNIPGDDVVDQGEVTHVSHLWTRVSDDDRCEMELGLVNPKRIVARLRGGFLPGIDLRCLRDALHDPETGLTYKALTRKKKQSVPDCERLINPGVISFLEPKGHESGAEVLRIIHNWHKAADGRGLSEEQRSSYFQRMKD